MLAIRLFFGYTISMGKWYTVTMADGEGKRYSLDVKLTVPVTGRNFPPRSERFSQLSSRDAGTDREAPRETRRRWITTTVSRLNSCPQYLRATRGLDRRIALGGDEQIKTLRRSDGFEVRLEFLIHF